MPATWPASVTRDFAIELAVLVDALEWMTERSEKTDTTLVCLHLNNAFTAGEIDQRIKKR